ncbi:type II CRISPR-associated endonuclease Cas1 [Corynebacterium accolens]|uniref:type II CRISPR-associated endonuclease Cas1 n=1 Tax=Corynebacterium accolens TaxID=38284 RepID=UPI0025431C03|nr:type II CRISPR-associated endonuclease Cas1 [Corynebacterium accolens]MDK4279210.1 type II CRISPR-associated endonuclease Cas1 [Corynebacterium accolens]MDK8821037.1 type II CRISPR-associated endonuclease Cas1 [Corynebacterium accolens]
MNAGWRVIDCLNLHGSLRYSRGQLVISKDDAADVAIPLSQIAVVLIGSKSSISGAVLQKFSDYDIALIVCDWRGVPVSGAYPWNQHSRLGSRQQAQAQLSVPKKKQAWTRIVAAKIHGQASVLKALQKIGVDELIKLSRTVKSGDPENREALAARKYWSCLSHDQAFSRLPGAGDPGWNSALDYGYTLLRGYGIRAIAGAGLSGTLGVFHHGRGNNWALVDDLMEPFRPMVDQIVFTNINYGAELDAAQKTAISTALTWAFEAGGKSLSTVFNEFGQHYGLYVEGAVRDLSVPRWEGILDASEG